MRVVDPPAAPPLALSLAPALASLAACFEPAAHSLRLYPGALLIIAGESRLAKLLEMFEFVATFKGRAFCYAFMGIYCLGIPGIGIGAMILSFILAVLQMVIAIKFGTQLEYDAIMTKA